MRSKYSLGGVLLSVLVNVGWADNALSPGATREVSRVSGSTFGDDVAFLKKHTDVIVLSESTGAGRVALVAGWQGRVMTSSAGGEGGQSFGWINRSLIASRQLLPHINVFGGEDRFWLGPEGGQFSIFFKKGDRFDFDHWFVPTEIDTMPFKVASQSADHAAFQAHFELTNYSGTHFKLAVDRKVQLLAADALKNELEIPVGSSLSLVGYESINTLTNTGEKAWKKETGLLSIWILGMFNPSPGATVVVPIKSGMESRLGVKVTSDYFGAIPPDRLVVRDDVIFLRGDGIYRSKIGVNPKRSRGRIGSYDDVHKVLTIVQFNQPKNVFGYVNSLWKMQKDPYSGDAINSYNDGPPGPGLPPLGPFFEMESSSPAAALEPGGSITHVHRTIHLTGPEDQLDAVARKVLGPSLPDIKGVFHGK